jgi:hypothetical protein
MALVERCMKGRRRQSSPDISYGDVRGGKGEVQRAQHQSSAQNGSYGLMTVVAREEKFVGRRFDERSKIHIRNIARQR